MSKSLLLIGIFLLFASVVFSEEEETAVFTKSDCVAGLTKSTFACAGFFERWHWDDEKKSCQKDVYGGCNPTRNNFETVEECTKIAKPECQ